MIAEALKIKYEIELAIYIYLFFLNNILLFSLF